LQKTLSSEKSIMPITLLLSKMFCQNLPINWTNTCHILVKQLATPAAVAHCATIMRSKKPFPPKQTC